MKKMETMIESSSRPSTALPPIAHLEGPVDKHEEQYRPRHTLPSPSSFRFESSHSKTSPTDLKSVLDTNKLSVEPQRTPLATPIRHSLPSIQEALGPDTSRPYNAPVPLPPPPPSAPVTSSAYFAHPATTASASSDSRRHSPTTYPPSSNVGSHPGSQPLRRSSFASSSTPSGQAAKNPSIQPIHTGKSPPYAYARSSGHYTPGSFSPSPHSAPVHATYPYSSHQTQYPPSSATTAAPNNQSHLMSAPPNHQHWPGESGMKSPSRPLRAHDSSVKRGLDQFDLEASFYELNTNGKRICDFGEDGAREARRIKLDGGVALHIPTPDEIESMSQAMANMQRAFHRIQEISQSHHAEAQAHQKEMRGRYESISGDPQEYMSDPHGNGSSMPPDAKKRRGRAAPPGRCHSCNRAETPEWRRGPDGARTLCNACGLHYAKLTRKMGPHQKAGISSSNLRPKGS